MSPADVNTNGTAPHRESVSDSARILFFDTTLRDGEQSPGCTMHADEKLRMAHQLAALGVDILEAGFAIASDGDLESIRTIGREIGKGGGKVKMIGFDAGDPFLSNIACRNDGNVVVWP